MSLVGFPQTYHVTHVSHHPMSHGGSGGGGGGGMTTGATSGRSGHSPEAVYVTATSAAAYYSPPTRYEDPNGTQSSALDSSYFPAAWTYAESQADIPSASAYSEYPTNSEGLLQAMDPNNCGGLSHQVQNSSPYGDIPHGVPVVRVVKRRCTANRKERRRTLSINNAFADLRDCIPNVPSDTKLSKIKTLRLATSYIAYLMDILAKDDPNLVPEGGFKAEVNKKIETREEKKKREMANLLGATCGEKRTKGRTGWPQHVWALELKQ